MLVPRAYSIADLDSRALWAGLKTKITESSTREAPMAVLIPRFTMECKRGTPLGRIPGAESSKSVWAVR